MSKATERDRRVYAELYALSMQSIEMMMAMAEAASPDRKAVDVTDLVAGLFKVAFDMGLRVGLSDIGRDVQLAIMALAEDAPVGGPANYADGTAPLVARFRDALGTGHTH